MEDSESYHSSRCVRGEGAVVENREAATTSTEGDSSGQHRTSRRSTRSTRTVARDPRLTLDIDDGEFLVLVGPSGCGKSTALRMIAGLETISSGELRIGGKLANDLEPKDRDIAMVFQSYALYPHLTVRNNIVFALKLQKMPKAEINARVGTRPGSSS